jgi:hypothetical protein
MFRNQNASAVRTNRPRPARLGGAVFGRPRARETPFHADKLRGDETIKRWDVWFPNIGPRSKLLWCQTANARRTLSDIISILPLFT